MTESFLSPAEIDHIKASVASAKHGLDILVDDFYSKLFDIDSTLRPLFATDLADQKRKLLAMLVTIVSLLDRPQQLLEAARHLGQRHTSYGVSVQDFDAVGEALLHALATATGDGWTFERQHAWERLYRVLSQEMLTAFA